MANSSSQGEDFPRIGNIRIGRREFIALGAGTLLTVLFGNKLPTSAIEASNTDSLSQSEFQQDLTEIVAFFQRPENQINLPKTKYGQLESWVRDYLKNELGRDYDEIADRLGIPSEMREHLIPFPTLLGTGFDELAKQLNQVFERFIVTFFPEEERGNLETFYSNGLRIEQPETVSDFFYERGLVSAVDDKTGEVVFYFKPEGQKSGRIPLFRASDPRLFSIPNNLEYNPAENVINSVSYKRREKTGLENDTILVEMINRDRTFERQVFVLEFDPNTYILNNKNINSQTENSISRQSVITNAERGAIDTFENAPESVFVTFSDEGEDGVKTYYIKEYKLADLTDKKVEGKVVLTGNENYRFVTILAVNDDGTMILRRSQPGTENRILTIYDPTLPEDKRETTIVNITKNAKETGKRSYPGYEGEINGKLIFSFKGYGNWNGQTLQYGAVFSIPKVLVKQKIQNGEEILESDFSLLPEEYQGKMEHYANIDIVERKTSEDENMPDNDKKVIYGVYRGVDTENLVMWENGRKHEIDIPEKGYYSVYYDNQFDTFFVTARRHAKPNVTYEVKFSPQENKFLVKHLFTNKWHPDIPEEIWSNTHTERQGVEISDTDRHTLSGNDDLRTTIPTIAIGYSEEKKIQYETMSEVNVRVYSAFGGAFSSTNLFDPSNVRSTANYATIQEGVLEVQAGLRYGAETSFEARGDIHQSGDFKRHDSYEECIDVVAHYRKLCPKANINLEGGSSGGWTASSVYLYALEKWLTSGEKDHQRYSNFLETVKKVNVQVPLTDPNTFAFFNDNAAKVLDLGYWDSPSDWRELYAGSPMGILENIQKILDAKPELAKAILPFLEENLFIIQFGTKDEVTPKEQAVRFYALLKETLPSLNVIAYSNDTNHGGSARSQEGIPQIAIERTTRHLLRSLGSEAKLRIRTGNDS